MKWLRLLIVLLAPSLWGQGVINPWRYTLGSTVAQLPAASSQPGTFYFVTDGASTSDCSTGGGSSKVICNSNGSSWSAVAGSGGGGSGTVSGQANGVIPLATASTTIGAQSHLDDGNTTAGTITSSEPITISGTPHGLTIPAGTAVSGAAGSAIYASDATNGYAEVNENNTGLSRICTAGNSQCVTSQFISSLTTTGSSGAATVTSGVLNIPQYSGGGLPTGTTGQTVYYASGGTTGTATSAIYIGGSSISSPVGIGTTTPVDITDFDNTTGFIPALVPASNTTLSSSATSSQTTFTVASTTGYPTQGVLLVGAGSFQGTAELVIYTGVSGGNTFTGLTRGAFGSAGTAQASSNTVQLVTEIHAETLTSTPWLVKLFGGGVMYYPSMNYINAAGVSPATGIQTYYNSAAFYQTLILSKSGNSGGGLSGAYIQGLLNGFTLSNQSNATTVLTEDGLGIPGYYTAAIAVTAISTTIAPVSGVVQLTGTAPTALATITAPANSSCTVTGISCQITFLGVGFATVTTGNIANVVAASADMTCTYLLSATKWYCK
jgi:hypothetical protein